MVLIKMKFVVYISERDFDLLDKFINFVEPCESPKFSYHRTEDNNLMVVLNKDEYYKLINE